MVYLLVFRYGNNCTNYCGDRAKDDDGQCPTNVSNYVCGGTSGNVPNGNCVGGGEDPNGFFLAMRQGSASVNQWVTCDNVSSMLSGTANGCGTCACVSAGFVAPFCVSELDMIIHTFGGHLSWFLVAILGAILVVGLAMVGVCRLAVKRRKQKDRDRALLDTPRVDNSNYHSLSATAEPLLGENGQSLVSPTNRYRGDGTNNGVANHLVRIYCEGRNSFDLELCLPLHPPPEIALLVDSGRYQEFATALNNFAKFTRFQKWLYYFWTVLFYPFALIYLQRLRKNIVVRLQVCLCVMYVCMSYYSDSFNEQTNLCFGFTVPATRVVWVYFFHYPGRRVKTMGDMKRNIVGQSSIVVRVARIPFNRNVNTKVWPRLVARELARRMTLSYQSQWDTGESIIGRMALLILLLELLTMVMMLLLTMMMMTTTMMMLMLIMIMMVVLVALWRH